jgi:group I intron endonuclease
MDVENCKKLKYVILDNKDDRCCEIYKITNNLTGKIYIGQAVSHILNHGRYRPYGCEGRFRCHISEAFSSKKNQSHFLNNAIRKYGKEYFVVELLEYCPVLMSDERELHYIRVFDSLYPNGYNLKLGGNVFHHSDESRRRVSSGVVNYYRLKKYEKFQAITTIDDDIDKYLRPLKKYGIQYGWYVYIDRMKADFGGMHISLEKSKNDALHFILSLKENLLLNNLAT